MNIINVIQGEEAIALLKSFMAKLPTSRTPYKIVHIDKVTLTNPIFKNKQTMTDLFFLCKDSSERPLFILSVIDVTNQDNCVKYFLHHDYNHSNMGTGYMSYNLNIGDKIYRFNTIPFCNPINQSRLYRETDKFSKILKGQLLDHNPADRFRSIEYIDIEGTERPLKCRECGALINTNAVNPLVAVSRMCPECLAKASVNDMMSFKEKLISIKESLKNKNKRFMYCRFYPTSWGYSVVDINERSHDLAKENYFSTYYKSFKDGDIKDDDCEIPTINKQALFAGLGSANSAIIDLTSRGDIINDYTLVDYDNVEYKNLRNQIYTRDSVGGLKTVGMENIINARYSGLPVTKPTISYKSSRIEEALMPFVNFKYLFSGFDSFYVRENFLNLIKENKFRGKYLIDTRYDGQNCSVFFIDLEKPEEVEYYEKLLKADKELFLNTKRALTEDEIKDYTDRMVKGSCMGTWTRLKKHIDDSTIPNINKDFPCGDSPIGCDGSNCHECIANALKTVRIPLEESENTCVAVNQIAIYKLVGTYVYLAIKQIEQGKDKPFTYIEVSTEEMPQVMMIRK